MQWLIDFANFLKDLFFSLLRTLLDGIKDVFLFMLDSLLNFIYLALDALDIDVEQFDTSAYMSQIPCEFNWVFNTMGLGDAMAILGTALAVRLSMALIPFVNFK